MITRRAVAAGLTLALLPAPVLADDGSPSQDPGRTLGRWNPAGARPLPTGSVPGLPPELRTVGVPGGPDKVLTKGGDANGYAEVGRPYTRLPRTRATGKLYSYDPVTGSDNYCSASVVRSKSRSLVLTAGHCLYDAAAGNWFKYFLFVPASDSGTGTQSAPYGMFPGLRAWVSPGWTRGKDSADLGIVAVGPNARGQRVQDAVGGGFIPRISKASTKLPRFVNLGYPGDAPYSRYDMHQCVGKVSYRIRVYSSADRPLATENCHAYGGNSGGPWVTASKGGWKVIGVLSSSSPYGQSGAVSFATRVASTNFGRIIGKADAYGRYADLRLTGAATTGVRFRYRVTVANRGVVKANRVVVRMRFSGVVNGLKTAAGKRVRCTRTGAVLVCRIPALKSGSKRSITLTGTPLGAVKVSASVKAATADRYQRNNSVSAALGSVQ